MHRSSWMLQQLEYATRGHHVAADASRIALLGATVTREKYVEYLARTYAFEAPIEARWKAMPAFERVIDLPRRLRVGYLASDLCALGSAPDNLMPAPLAGVEEALGWMYVVERGRRMNGLLLRHLQRRIPAVVAIAGNYLAASAVIGTRWQQLGEVLDRIGHHHAITDQIMNAAHRAFRSLRTTLTIVSRSQQAA